MFKIVRTYGDASTRDFLINLTETQADNYISRAKISGTTRSGKTFNDSKKSM